MKSRVVKMDGTPNGLNLSSLTTARKEQLMKQTKAEVALVSAQELLQKLSDMCFKKCVSKPGTTLDSSEQKCVGLCMDRSLWTWRLLPFTAHGVIVADTVPDLGRYSATFYVVKPSVDQSKDSDKLQGQQSVFELVTPFHSRASVLIPVPLPAFPRTPYRLRWPSDTAGLSGPKYAESGAHRSSTQMCGGSLDFPGTASSQGALEKYVNLLRSLYTHSSGRVRACGQRSRAFITSTGVRQGCPISALFNFLLDDILELALEESSEPLPGIRLTDMEHSDDIVLLGSSAKDTDHVEQSVPLVTVDSFTYLSSTLSSACSIADGISAKVAKTQVAFPNLSSVTSKRRSVVAERCMVLMSFSSRPVVRKRGLFAANT
ncbi:uncharacterized protein DEA37_0006160 [Paragonimus westermani]|uniref:Tim10-like domain-containing protein n=1 Tax=Paragonimus westermani TaxID=34504 RepID=A0A5J4NH79_9TREM|nr:uncharacterized protein DEA37_0006160 [Paragonimus westermani]